MSVMSENSHFKNETFPFYKNGSLGKDSGLKWSTNYTCSVVAMPLTNSPQLMDLRLEQFNTMKERDWEIQMEHTKRTATNTPKTGSNLTIPPVSSIPAHLCITSSIHTLHSCLQFITTS